MKARCFKMKGYEVCHTRLCLVLLGKIGLKRVPLRASGREWPIGTRFTYLGGTNNSAGFETLSFRGLAPLEYRGQFYDLELEELACFKTGLLPRGGYWAWSPTEWGLIWGTDVCAGRVIQMTKAKWFPPKRKLRRT